MKKVLFLGCNHLQTGYLAAARDLGFRVIATDRNPEAPGADLAHEFHAVGYQDHQQLLTIARLADLQPGDHIFTASAHFAYEGAARLAEALGLEFPSPQTVDQCLDKRKFYDLLRQQKIPLPPTRIFQPGMVLDPGRGYYLKSDYGKTPRYNFHIHDRAPVLPECDQYYRDCFLLQEEIIGTHFRVNIYGDQMAVFISRDADSFEPLASLPRHHDQIRAKLNSLIAALGLGTWLIKFDVLMDLSGWYIIDLGLDPPMRLRQFCQWQGLDFCNLYIRQYLITGQQALPPWSDLYRPVRISGTTSRGFQFNPSSFFRDEKP